jgi:hypothetical protein
MCWLKTGPEDSDRICWHYELNGDGQTVSPDFIGVTGGDRLVLCLVNRSQAESYPSPVRMAKIEAFVQMQQALRREGLVEIENLVF